MLTSLRFTGILCTTVLVFCVKVGLGAGASIGSLQTQQFLAVGLFLCPFWHSLYAVSLVFDNLFYGP
jgi:hypothetical protein